MSYHELNKLRNVVSQAANALYGNEKFTTGVLAVKARKIAELNPHDSTSVAMYRFLESRAQNERELFISRSELKSVYNKLYTNNNKFGQYFKDELGLEKDTTKVQMKRDPGEGTPLVEDFKNHMGDNFDVNAYSALKENLESVLDRKPIKSYSSKIAKLAQKTCARELNAHGLLPKNIEVVAGQSDVVICRATYDTPKGQSSLLIPVEIKHNIALSPDMFLNTSGFTRINNSAITGYLKATAGKLFKVNAERLLKDISKVKNAKAEPKNGVKAMLNKVASKRGSPMTDMNNIILQEVDPIHPDVMVPDVEVPEEVTTFAKSLTSNAGVAEFTFGKDAINAARQLILFEMKQAGFKNPQVVIASSDEGSVTYAVSINSGYGFKASVKFADKKPVMPSIIVSNGNVYRFNANGIGKLIANGDSDSRAVAQTSPLYNEKASEIVNRIRAYVNNREFDKAADAVNVLKSSNDQVAYQTGYRIYTDGLGAKKVASVKTECKKQVKLNNSAKVVCSHTGLPLEKIYQDKHGNCIPLYRRGMEETSEGVATIHSKVFFS